MTILDYIGDLQDAAQGLRDADFADDTSNAMLELRKAMHALQEIAPLLVERGVRAGMTQRRMARLMDIPESALRGARQEFSH